MVTVQKDSLHPRMQQKRPVGALSAVWAEHCRCDFECKCANRNATCGGRIVLSLTTLCGWHSSDFKSNCDNDRLWIPSDLKKQSSEGTRSVSFVFCIVPQGPIPADLQEWLQFGQVAAILGALSSFCCCFFFIPIPAGSCSQSCRCLLEPISAVIGEMQVISIVIVFFWLFSFKLSFLMSD